MVADPAGPTAAAFMELGAAVVQEVAKLKLVPRSAVRSVASPHSVATAHREAARKSHAQMQQLRALFAQLLTLIGLTGLTVSSTVALYTEETDALRAQV